MSTVPLDTALAEAAARLAEAGIEEARREARLLMVHALGIDQAGLLRRRGIALTQEEQASFESMVERRAARVPASQILGRRGFWSLDFEISDATLTPRPDSEAMLDMALELRPERPAVQRILDLGTGTGCLLLSALAEYGDAFGLGVDLSPAAAHIARRNVLGLGFAARAAIIIGAWDAALDAQRAGGFDLLLCNPPYIPTEHIAGLMPEVRLYEPRAALDGGSDGLDPYRLLFPRIARLLAPNGLALFEFGLGQEEELRRLAATCGLACQGIRTDLGGHPRIIAISVT